MALSASRLAAQKPSCEVPDAAVAGVEAVVAEQLEGLEDLAVADLEAGAESAAEAVGELGRHLHAYGLTESAAGCYRLAAELAPRDFQWPYLLGYLNQSAGRLEEAARLYEKALAIVPGVSPALIRLAATYAELGNPDKAEWLYREALRSDTASAAAEAGLGELLLSLDRTAEGAALLERALAKVPEANRLFYPLALAYRKLGEEEKARELLAWRGSVGLKPADPLIDSLAELKTGERVFLLQGQSAFRVGRFEEAAEKFERAVEINPSSISALINLGSAQGEMGRAEEAIRTLERAVELAPGNETALFNLGVLRSRRGEYELAIDALSQAGQYAPTDGRIRFELAQALRQVGRWEDSILHFDAAIKALPALDAPRLGKAQALTRLGRLAEARKTLEDGLDELPESPALTQALSRVLALAKDPELRDSERAVQLALNLFEARQNLADAEWVAEALAAADRCQEAADWQRRVVEQAAGAQQPADVLDRLRGNLQRFERGAPCGPGSADS